MNVKRAAQAHSKGCGRAGTAESWARAFPVGLCLLSKFSSPQSVPWLLFLSFLHLSLSHGEPGLILLSLVPVKFF